MLLLLRLGFVCLFFIEINTVLPLKASVEIKFLLILTWNELNTSILPPTLIVTALQLGLFPHLNHISIVTAVKVFLRAGGVFISCHLSCFVKNMEGYFSPFPNSWIFKKITQIQTPLSFSEEAKQQTESLGPICLLRIKCQGCHRKEAFQAGSEVVIFFSLGLQSGFELPNYKQTALPHLQHPKPGSG